MTLQHEGFERQTFAVGRVNAKGATMARRCAWCGAWETADDEMRAVLGAKASHSICDSLNRR